MTRTQRPSAEAMANHLQHVSATRFKADCLHLIDEVAQKRAPITECDKPVAKLVPVDESPIDPFGCMAGDDEDW